jgi:hypothetical protein
MGAGTGKWPSRHPHSSRPAASSDRRCLWITVVEPGPCPRAGPSDPVATVAAMSQIRRPPTEPGGGLGLCRTCRSELGYPRRCRRLGNDLWELELRCPECDDVWRAQGSTREIEGFDRTLAAGRAVIERHLREIDRLEREAEIDRFSRALAADAILPEDFTS